MVDAFSSDAIPVHLLSLEAVELLGRKLSPRGVGGRLASVRNVAGDLVLERNQALRAAVLDVAHVTTLLAYLSALADRRGDAMLAAWHRRWEVRLREAEERVMATIVALAEDPGDAILPASQTTAGRAGHGIANALGTLGEAIDGSAVGRAARKVGGARPNAQAAAARPRAAAARRPPASRAGRARRSPRARARRSAGAACRPWSPAAPR